MSRSRSIWRNLDWITFGLYCLLVTFGWLIVYAVQYDPESASFTLSSIPGRQLTWLIISLAAGFTILLFDSEFFPSFAWPIYGVLMLLLVVVMFVGREVNGARSWLEFGSVKIQPAEFAKYATALALAKYLSGKKNLREMRDRAIAVMIPVIPMGLIVLQQDLGSALVFVSFLIVLYREGFPVAVVVAGAYLGFLFLTTLAVGPVGLQIALAIVCFLVIFFALQRHLRRNRTQTIYLLVLLAIGLALLTGTALLTRSLILTGGASVGFLILLGFASAFLRKDRRWVVRSVAIFVGSMLFSVFLVDYVTNDILEPHQRDRILTLVGQGNADNYNVEQSKMTIASGGVTGKGYLEGTLTRFGHVPEQQTDFIFCTIGEEFGFIGSVLFLGTYLFLLIRIILLAERQRSKFSRDFAYGVAGLFFVQIAINVGMTIGLVPVIGIPLPFISYGGSSVLAFSVLIFTMLRLDADRLLVLR